MKKSKFIKDFIEILGGSKSKMIGNIIGFVTAIAFFCTLRVFIGKWVYAVFGGIFIVLMIILLRRKNKSAFCDAFFLFSNGAIMLYYGFNDSNKYILFAALFMLFLYSVYAVYDLKKEKKGKENEKNEDD